MKKEDFAKRLCKLRMNKCVSARDMSRQSVKAQAISIILKTA